MLSGTSRLSELDDSWPAAAGAPFVKPVGGLLQRLRKVCLLASEEIAALRDDARSRSFRRQQAADG